jgi:hypothetical protein
MDRHDHGFVVRDAIALSPDPRYLVARPLPEISERATDIASSTYHCDLYFASSSSLGSRVQLLAVPTTLAGWKRKPCLALLYRMTFALGSRCDMAWLPNAWSFHAGSGPTLRQVRPSFDGVHRTNDVHARGRVALEGGIRLIRVVDDARHDDRRRAVL